MKQKLLYMIGIFALCGCNVEIDSDMPADEPSTEVTQDTCKCETQDPGEAVENKVIAFEDVCIFSGGRLNKDGRCVCVDEQCPEGVICISDAQNHPACAVKLKSSVCTDGEKMCQENRVLGCAGGQWEIVETCEGENGSCSDGACVRCIEDMTKCESDKEFICKDGKWEISRECDEERGCYKNKYCNECMLTFETPNGMLSADMDRCLDDHVLGICKEGKLYPHLCDGEGLCRYDKKEEKSMCMVCNEEVGDVKHDFAYLQMCTDGAWGERMKCDHGTQSLPVCKTCANEKSICFMEGISGAPKAYVCEDSFWVLKDNYQLGDCAEMYVKTDM